MKKLPYGYEHDGYHVTPNHGNRGGKATWVIRDRNGDLVLVEPVTSVQAAREVIEWELTAR